MSNDYFNASGTPAQGSAIASPAMRSELAAVAAGFDKLPTLTANGYEIVYVNAAGAALATVGGDGLLKLSTAGIPSIAAAGTDYVGIGAATASGLTVSATAKLLGRSTAGAGAIEEISCTAAGRAILDDADATAQRATLGLAIGTDVQAYDADTAKLDVDQTWSGAQRGTLTTDNDGSFDQNVTNNFKCTPTGAAALTFTNHTSGQTGLIIFINGSNYTITAAATTYIAAADLVKLSATGNYVIAYIDDGTNAYCTVTAALTSAGA